ncbi:MAG: ABC transporter substrate-binding protein, partial [Myxococcota bacterium]|nr:ABC transporter substrate-binding protein [Myxococcota bacterium]
ESATKNIRRLGEIFGESTKAEALVSALEAKLADAKKLSQTFTKKPKVLFIYARGSRVLNISGHSTSAHAVIELAGGTNAFGDIEGFKPMTSEAVVAAQPDVILMLSRGVGSIGGEAKVFDLPGIALTPAGKNRQVLVMDDLKLLGFGPRLGEAILELTTAFAGADKASGQL